MKKEIEKKKQPFKLLRKGFIATMVGLTVLSGGVLLSGCAGQTGEQGQRGPQGEQGIQGPAGQDATYKTYRVTYDYGLLKDEFELSYSNTDYVKSTEWITDLPEIKPFSLYSENFLGWFIQGTDIQVNNYDFIGGDVTLEARFDIMEEVTISSMPAGLYQNGKYIQSWSDFVAGYSNAFVDNKIVSKSENESYFKDLEGELIIDKSITSIGDSAFKNCKKLTKIVMSNEIATIGNDAFYGSANLKSVIISRNITKIPNNMFSYCYSLKGIVIPNGVTEIGEYAFSGCGGDIRIPNGVKTICKGAFENCSGLINVVIPNSVISINGNVFLGCGNIKTIEVEEGNTVYDSRKDCHSIIEIGTKKLISGCQSTTVPSEVTEIGSYAFAGSSLAVIKLPNSVTKIGESAFFGCKNLTNVNIPDGVTTISRSTFESCDKLKNINIPSSVEVIGESAFALTGLTSVTIPEGVKTINYKAFTFADLTSISIPSSVIYMGDDVFRGCSDLTSIVVAEGNTVYDSRNNCNAIIKTETNELIQGCNTTVIPNGVSKIGDSAFIDCKFTSINIPNSVTSIGDNAFEDCVNLITIIMPEGVQSIGEYTFYFCENLTTVVLPTTLTIIGNCAFAYCKNLTTINIPSNLSSMGDDVFYGCEKLES